MDREDRGRPLAHGHTISEPYRATRRALIGGSVAVAAGSGFRPAWADDSRSSADIPLATLARAKGMRFGTAVGFGLSDPDYRRLIARECDILVPENAMKMYAVHGAPDVWTFGPADQLAAFARERHMALRGHNLVWARDDYTPQWLKHRDFGPNPKLEAERFLRDYIGVVTRRYAGQVTSWDVVNEAINPATGHIRDFLWGRLLGANALKIAYGAAREALPDTQLVYNDYMSWDAGDETHRQGVLTLLRWFRKNDVPVDALGVQSHINAGHDLSAAQTSTWKTFLDEVVDLGYGLLITEFDVNDQTLAGSPAERDREVAEIGRAYLDLMLAYPRLRDVLVWGLSDKYTWLGSVSPRADRLPARPTPFDGAFQAKPLREAIAAAFRAAPAR